MSLLFYVSVFFRAIRSRSFHKLSDCLDVYYNDFIVGTSIIPLEFEANRRCYFVIHMESLLNQLFETAPIDRPSLYEVLFRFPRRLYFDIDLPPNIYNAVDIWCAVTEAVKFAEGMYSHIL